MFIVESPMRAALRQECNVYSGERNAAPHSVRSAMFIVESPMRAALRQECHVYRRERKIERRSPSGVPCIIASGRTTYHP